MVVTDDLASVDDRRVFAIGDCAQPPEGGSGLVAQGWEQSRRLARLLAAPRARTVEPPGRRAAEPASAGPAATWCG